MAFGGALMSLKKKGRALFPTFAMLAALVGVGGAFFLQGSPRAQSTSEAQEVVPSIQIVKGALVSPTAANEYYGSATTHTDGLCRDYAANAGVCPSGVRPLAPEIVELSRALGGDRTGAADVTEHINLVYEYVRNRIDTEFMFGAHKGSVGVILDGSGTAFDQAVLMVDLLKASGETATLKYGTITLTQQQFLDWTGISQAKAACQFLAQGGIPGVVANGCSSTGGTGAVSLNHVWVEAVTPDGAFLFDPSYKPYTHRAGIDLAAATGLSAGEAAAEARNNGAASSTTVGHLDASGLGGLLQDASESLLTRLKQADMQGADMSEVVGGRTIQPYIRTGAGLQQTSLPYTTGPVTTWTAMPDQFRAKFSVTVKHNGSTQYAANFFTDEIYGRKLQILPEQVAATEVAAAYAYRPRLVWDGVTLHQGVGINDIDEVALDLELGADHPFAAPEDGSATTGKFGDVTVKKRAKTLLPIAIVHAWGVATSRIGEAWDREQGVDSRAPNMWVSNNQYNAPEPTPPSSSGDLLRARVGASWLAQFTDAANIHAEIADARVVLLHTVGIVAADMNLVRPVSPPRDALPDEGLTVADETTVIDLETTFGLTSRTADAIDRRAAVHAIAATAAALEGSVIEQLMDTPDTASTARRLAWGNDPESGTSPSTSTRGVRRFTAGTSTNPDSYLVVEGLSTGVHGTWNSQPSLIYRNAFFNRLSDTITAYTGEGYDVTASTEALLGPGHRHGSEYVYNAIYDYDVYGGEENGPASSTTYQYRRAPSLQDGGALIANRYDSSGDPDRIAHVLTGYNGLSKGGGGASTSRENNFDPKTAADSLKDRFVDRSSALGVNLMSGTAGFSTPVLKSIGQGDAPHMLSYAVEVRGGQLNTPAIEPDIGDPRDKDGVVTNWHGSADIGSSGLEAMGESRVEAATATIVAFMAMQDIWRETPGADREIIGALTADWWGRSILMNVVTVMQGAASEQFVKLADDSFIAAGGGAASVTVTGTREAVRLPKFWDGTPPPGSSQAEEISRVWDTTALGVSVKGAHGDVRSYQRWAWGFTIGGMYGFRLSEWDYPEGVTLTVDYGTALLQPTEVTSNLGLTLTLPALAEHTCVLGTAVTPVSVTDAGSGVHKAAFKSPIARTTTQRPIAGCLLEKTFSPGSSTIPSVQYAYDTVGRIKEARDAIAVANPSERGAHLFQIADGYRGEREDPLGGRYAVETLSGGRLRRDIDEMGRIAVSTFDGRGRVLTRMSPYGDTTAFKYDARDNVVERTQTPFAGCVASYGTGNAWAADWWCQTITIKAEYHASWNKPTKVTLPATVADPSERHWLMSYNSQGLLYQATGPEVWDARNGVNANAVWTTWYDSYGRVTKTRDPTGVEATQTWGGGGLPAYCLRESRMATQSGGIANMTTTFGCDATGNVTSVTDARGNATTATYDAMRRKTGETGPSGTNIQTQWVYDANGDVTQEKRWDHAASAWRTTATTYSLTRKPLTVSDPAGDTARSCYDALDRPVVMVDPQLRATKTEYNRASQPTVVRRWHVADPGSCTTTFTAPPGTGQTEDRWRRFGYNAAGLQTEEVDARGNVTTVEYDGLGRAARTIFPKATPTTDATQAWVMRDQRNQVVVKKQRNDSWVALYYDAMGRDMHVQEYVNGATGFEGRSSRGAYDLAGRPVWRDVSTQGVTFDADLLRDIRTYGYDGAGRLTADQVQPEGSGSGAITLAIGYDYDLVGNRTSITWPGAWTAIYTFDAANRPLTVAFPGGGGTQTVTLAHDSLSRRTSIDRPGVAADTSYSYEADSDLASLGHGFVAGSGPGAVTFSYGHDASAKVTSVGISQPAFEWLPSLAYARNYGSANGLNQASSEAAVEIEWDDLNGNMTSDGITDFEWTNGNLMIRAERPGMIAAYAYDSDNRRTKKTVNGLVTRTLWSGADELAELDASGATLRRFVPDGTGAMDARLATVEAGGDVYWLHTDHQGSVIATSNAAGQVVGAAKYSPYGELPSPTDLPPAQSPFGYTGRQYDPETGLYQYRARYYSPRLGVFLSTDPIGTKDDPNLYMYVGLDPVNATDPTGKAGCGNLSRDHCHFAGVRQQLALMKINQFRSRMEEYEKAPGSRAGRAFAREYQALMGEAPSEAGMSRLNQVLNEVSAFLRDPGVAMGGQFDYMEGGEHATRDAETRGNRVYLFSGFFNTESYRRGATSLIHEGLHTLVGLGQDRSWNRPRSNRTGYVRGYEMATSLAAKRPAWAQDSPENLALLFTGHRGE